MWDERYAQKELAYGAEPNDFLRERAAEIPGSPVLCLAAGQGRNEVYLAKLGYDVIALDQSSVGLQRATALADSVGVSIETVVADLSDWQFPEAAYAGITSIWCHLPPELREAVHHSVVQALVPGGVFILEAYTPEQVRHGTGGPPVRDLMMTAAGLRRELDGLEILHLEELERDVSEGPYHQGLSAVVQLVARRPLS